MVNILITNSSSNTIHVKIFEDKYSVTVEAKGCRIPLNGNKLSMVLCNRLSSEQEQADAKMFYIHMAFDVGFEKINIVTVEAEVSILGMYY